MLQDFKDKVVVITGASSGIGAATAIMFAQRGAKVTLCGRDEHRLSATLNECLKIEGSDVDRYLATTGDLTKAETRKQIVEKTIEKFGRLDVLVPNAGIIETKTIKEETEESFDSIINTNVKATFFLIKAAIPHLIASKGCIVTVSSIGSTVAYPTEIVYSMSKAAIDHMTRTLALDLAPQGVRVNAINPTFVWTRIYRNDHSEANTTFLKECAAAHPLHGRASTVEEQADVILFLASNAARFVTGECIKVDGAATLLCAPSMS